MPGSGVSVVAYDVDAVGAEAEEGGGVTVTLNLNVTAAWLLVWSSLGPSGLIIAGLLLDWPWLRWLGVAATLVMYTVTLVVSVVVGDWFTAVAAAVAVVVIVWLLRGIWRGRGRRVLRVIGAKSWARLAAVVRKAREAARPRPVLRPAPGGAR